MIMNRTELLRRLVMLNLLLVLKGRAGNSIVHCLCAYQIFPSGGSSLSLDLSLQFQIIRSQYCVSPRRSALESPQKSETPVLFQLESIFDPFLDVQSKGE